MRDWNMNSHYPNGTNVNLRCSTIDTATPCNKTTTVDSSNTTEPLLFMQEQQSLLSTYRVPRQRRPTNSTNNCATGLWSEDEQHQFLTGLTIYGWGQWKEIGTIVTTRSNRQIKSHGQKVATKYYEGANIFEPLMQLNSAKNYNMHFTAEMYPPNRDTKKSKTDKKKNSKALMMHHDSNESNTMAEILCSLKHRTPKRN